MTKVFVKNIPFSANENIIINTLSKDGYGPICGCELKPHRTRINCNNGSGYVEFEDERSANNCIARTTYAPPICMGRPLKILPARINKTVQATDFKNDFSLSSLEIGNWSSEMYTFITEWQYPQDYEKPTVCFSKDDDAFILEGFNSVNSDKESVKRRVKIPFRILAENSRGIFLDSRDDVVSLYISLKQPPYLYRNAEMKYTFDLDVLKNYFNFPINSKEWIRTVDWIGVFGTCLVYKLVFRDDLNELRDTLDNFKFRGISPPIPQIIVRCIEKPDSENLKEIVCELLPFNVFFKLESLISHGILRPYEIEEYKLGERLGELIHNENKETVAMFALNQISTKHWDPFDERHKERPISIYETALKNFTLWHPNINPSNTSRYALVNHATITPTKIYYDGPVEEPLNRILRHYKDKADSFLRVTFREENFERLFVNKDEDIDIINMRIMHTKNNGFHLAGRHYEFLAFSSSQLKEASCWFVASDGEFNANSIRVNMGKFDHIKIPALYAARMGQCFTSAMGALKLNREQIKKIEDIVENNFTFSDGCGKISPSLAERAAKEYWGTKSQNDEVPSVFQIRIGGCKGVVAVDPNIKDEGDVLYIRPSQTKFEVPNDFLNLEIVRTVKSPLPGHLNRQIIMLLSALGVRDHVFIELQKEMCADINSMMINEEKARKILKRSLGVRECSHITRTIISMVDAGMMRNETFDPFLKAFLECKRIYALKLLRCKARILVPNSFLLIGVIDETGKLEENQIYVQTSTIISEHQTFGTTYDKVERETNVWTDPAVITRNPCLHPGDLRIVEAVNIPELSHLKNCVVFSQKGYKPLPSLLSGGDLDGDDFFVCFDKQLLIKNNEEPMDYSPPEKIPLNRSVLISDICEFFKNFMLNNRLGQISHLHMAIADYQEDGVKFDGCKGLAKLHSDAVDFSKTGVPVLERLPTIDSYPDFMEKDNKRSYKSERILGKLYRNIKVDRSEKDPLLNYDTGNIIPNEEFLFHGYQHYLEEADIYRNHYNNDIRNLMKKYKVKTEAEVISAQLLGRKIEGKRSQDIREELSRTISFTIYNFRKTFLMGLGLQDTDDNDTDDVTPLFCSQVTIPINDETKAKASAWYYVTYNKEEYPDQDDNILLSFPWIVADVLLAIKKEG